MVGEKEKHGVREQTYFRDLPNGEKKSKRVVENGDEKRRKLVTSPEGFSYCGTPLFETNLGKKERKNYQGMKDFEERNNENTSRAAEIRSKEQKRPSIVQYPHPLRQIALKRINCGFVQVPAFRVAMEDYTSCRSFLKPAEESQVALGEKAG